MLRHGLHVLMLFFVAYIAMADDDEDYENTPCDDYLDQFKGFDGETLIALIGSK